MPSNKLHFEVCQFRLHLRIVKVVLTMCDCVFPWCFLANSAASPLAPPESPEDFKCAGSALLVAIVYELYYLEVLLVEFVEKGEDCGRIVRGL